MVDWSDPLELCRIAGRVLLGEVFGSYADKREVQAALDPKFKEPTDYSDHSTLWFDYVADVGDGFDATYAIATLLARDHLGLGEGSVETDRGRFLIFGGDQVYPTASLKAYRDRTLGPYEMAFPEHAAGRGQHDLFAIPGNHDWYDGLTSFVRIFCQDNRIGGWTTRQSRSYFCIKLPHNWWIWGIDIQLEAAIDFPQLQYFKAMAARMTAESGGARPQLLIVTAEPAWAYSGSRERDPETGKPLPHEAHAPYSQRPNLLKRDPGAIDNLARFLHETVPDDMNVRLIMSGDLHHYARYTERERTRRGEAKSQWRPLNGPARHYVTAGGGGAYSLGTHHLPDALVVDEYQHASWCERNALYPQPGPSRAATWSYFRGPWFMVLVGCIYLLLGWQLQSSSRHLCVNAPNTIEEVADTCWGATQSRAIAAGDVIREISLLDLLAELPPARWPVWIARAVGESPAWWIEVLGLTALLVAFADAQSSKRRVAVGVVHTCVHVLAAGLLMMVVGGLLHGLGLTGDSPWRRATYTVVLALAGAFTGSLVFAIYLNWSAHRRPGAPHMNEVFSFRRLTTWKHFVRFHLTKDGMRVRVIGLDDVPAYGVVGRTMSPWQPGSGDVLKDAEPLVPRIVDDFLMPNQEIPSA
jgi:hypothetical protein